MKLYRLLISMAIFLTLVINPVLANQKPIHSEQLPSHSSTQHSHHEEQFESNHHDNAFRPTLESMQSQSNAQLVKDTPGEHCKSGACDDACCPAFIFSFLSIVEPNQVPKKALMLEIVAKSAYLLGLYYPPIST